jgi:predicted DNA binding CopG/RHH family protein
MKKAIKKIPKFKNEEEEIKFWDKNDISNFVDFSKGQRMIFPNLKPSTSTISLRLPEELLNQIKSLANRRDVPYQSLIKIILAEKIQGQQLGPKGPSL